MGAVLTRLLEVFYTKKLDIVVIGLENRYASFLLDHAPCGISVLHAEREHQSVRPENFRHISVIMAVMCLDEQIFDWWGHQHHNETGIKSVTRETSGSVDAPTTIVLSRCHLLPSLSEGSSGIGMPSLVVGRIQKLHFSYSNSRLISQLSFPSRFQW